MVKYWLSIVALVNFCNFKILTIYPLRVRYHRETVKYSFETRIISCYSTLEHSKSSVLINLYFLENCSELAATKLTLTGTYMCSLLPKL